MDETFFSITELKDYLKDFPDDTMVKLTIETGGGEKDESKEPRYTSDKP